MAASASTRRQYDRIPIPSSWRRRERGALPGRDRGPGRDPSESDQDSRASSRRGGGVPAGMADPSAKRSEGVPPPGRASRSARRFRVGLSQPLLREGRFRDVQDLADVPGGRRHGASNEERHGRGAGLARAGISGDDRVDVGAAAARGARRRAVAGAGVVGAGLHALGPEEEGAEVRLLDQEDREDQEEEPSQHRRGR